MKAISYLKATRCLFISLLVGGLIFSLKLGLLVGLSWPMNDLSAFAPPSAEYLGRAIARSNGASEGPDGMLRIVQRQHVASDLMFARLETSEALSRALAIYGLVASIAVTVVSVLGLWVARKARRNIPM